MWVNVHPPPQPGARKPLDQSSGQHFECLLGVPRPGAYCSKKARSGRYEGAMHQVADWLEKLGLGQYAQRFAENDIDFALLTKLTDADLKELGVTSLGHRKRLLEAIPNLDKVAVPSAPWLHHRLLPRL